MALFVVAAATVFGFVAAAVATDVAARFVDVSERLAAKRFAFADGRVASGTDEGIEAAAAAVAVADNFAADVAAVLVFGLS